MADVYQRCIKMLNRLRDAKGLPRHCERLVVEYEDAWSSVTNLVDVIKSSDESRLLSSSCNSALTELWCVMVDGQMLVRDCLSSRDKGSPKTNPRSVEISFCLNVENLYACVDILKSDYAEAAGQQDFENVTPIKTVAAKVNRMKAECCEELHCGKQKACDKICFDELIFMPGEKGYDMGAFGPVENYRWFNETVAVRNLPDVDGKLLQSRASKLISLQHPHLVQVMGYGFDEARRGGFLAMEYIEQNLKTLVDMWSAAIASGRASFPFAKVLHILLEVAMAMEYLHDNDVVHCDLSTQNVLVVPVNPLEMDAPEGGYVHVKLSFFNLAESETPKSCLLKTSSDQAHAKPADVYKFALMCFEILGGELERLGSNVEIFSLTFLTWYLKRCLDPIPERRPIFAGICTMFKLCKDIMTRTFFPSTFPSANKVHAEAFYKLLGFEGCTEGELLLPPEIFLEVLIHALQRQPTDTELESLKWKTSLLRASQYCGGWTVPAPKISDPKAIFDAIEQIVKGEAIWRLGLCYELGRVVGVDETKAVSMYEKAITQGFISASVDLGLCKAFGRGVEKFRPKADQLWLEAIQHQNECQRPDVSVCELIQSLKTLLLNANRSDLEDDLVRAIRTRLMELSQKSAVGKQLVSGPSYCNVSSLSSLQGLPTIDYILEHLAYKDAGIRKHLQENQVAVRDPHRAPIYDLGAFVDYGEDRLDDGVSIVFKFMFHLFIYGFTMSMAIIVPFVLAVFFLTASKFWLAGIFLVVTLVIWFSRGFIGQIVVINEIRSILSGTHAGPAQTTT